MSACVSGAPISRDALALTFFYFKTGANKLVNLIGNEHMTLAKLSINIVAWISLPNEANDLKKNLAVSPECGITSLQKYERSTTHSRIF
jgi:hypothetical protein